jgi:hypothetical protein
MFNPKTLVEA